MGKQPSQPPVVIKLTLIAVIVLLNAWFFRKVWDAEGVIPEKYYSQITAFNLALKCSVAITALISLMITTIVVNRIFTEAGDTLNGEEGTFIKVSKMILQNTYEQSFIFIVNLFAAASLGLNNEKILILGLIFIGARIIFWIGYLIGAYTQIPPFRSFGFSLTFCNNMFLLGYNIKTLLRI